MQCLEVSIKIQNIFTGRIMDDLLWDMVESLLLEVLNSKSDVSFSKYVWAQPQDVSMVQYKVLLML